MASRAPDEAVLALALGLVLVELAEFPLAAGGVELVAAAAEAGAEAEVLGLEAGSGASFTITSVKASARCVAPDAI